MALFWFSPAAIEIAVIAFFVAIFSQFVRMRVMDMEKYRETQAKMKEQQKLLKEAQKAKDMKAMQKAQEQMMGYMMTNMKESYKPMVITIIPILLVFWWMGASYGDIGAVHNATVVEALPANVSILSASTTPVYEQFGFREKIKRSIVGGPPPRMVINGSWHPDRNAFIWEVADIPNYGKQTLTLNVTLAEPAIPRIEDDIHSIDYLLVDDYTYRYGLATERLSELTTNPDAPGLSYTKTVPEDITTPVTQFSYDIIFSNTSPYAVSSIFGYELGWLGTYFVTVMVFSIPLGKFFRTM